MYAINPWKFYPTHKEDSYGSLIHAYRERNVSISGNITLITDMEARVDCSEELDSILHTIDVVYQCNPGHLTRCVRREGLTYIVTETHSDVASLFEWNEWGADGLTIRELLHRRDACLRLPPKYTITEMDIQDVQGPSLHHQHLAEGEEQGQGQGPMFSAPPPLPPPLPSALRPTLSFFKPPYVNQLFQPHYVRNNKSNGKKNLRCFPRMYIPSDAGLHRLTLSIDCTRGRHNETHFCGDAITVHVSVPSHGEREIGDIMVLAHFVYAELDGPPLESVPYLRPGGIYEPEEITRHLYSEKDPLLPLLPAVEKCAGRSDVSFPRVFVFKENSRAWHYGWAAPTGNLRRYQNFRHFLQVSCISIVEGKVHCLQTLLSESFLLYSARRARMKKDVD
jgi:hypothetical protein